MADEVVVIKAVLDGSAAQQSLTALTRDQKVQLTPEVDRSSRARFEAQLAASSRLRSAKINVDLVGAAAANVALARVAKTREALVRVRTVTANAASGAASAASSGIAGATAVLGPLAVAGTAVAAGLGAAGVALGFLGKQASDVGESLSAATQVFGAGVSEIDSFAQSAADSIGQSRNAALEASTTFGVFGKAAGLTGKDLSGFSTGLVTLASDAASFKNTSPEEAIVAIGAALRGETEPIRRYGVLLSEASMKQTAYAQGIAAPGAELTEQQKILARYAVILAQTSDIQGDFGRTSGSLPNRVRTLKATLTDSLSRVGEAVLPSLITIVESIMPIIEQIEGPLTQVASVVGAAFASVASGVSGAFGGLSSLLAGPIGLIKALGEGLSIIWDSLSSSGVIGALGEVFSTITAVISPLLPLIGGIAGGLISILGPAVKLVGKLIVGLGKVILTIFEKLAQGISKALETVNGFADFLVPDAVIDGLNSMEETSRTSLDSLNNLGKETESTSDSMDTAADSVSGASTEMDGLAGAADGAAVSLTGTAESAEAMADRITAAYDKVRAATDAQFGLQNAQIDLANLAGGVKGDDETEAPTNFSERVAEAQAAVSAVDSAVAAIDTLVQQQVDKGTVAIGDKVSTVIGFITALRDQQIEVGTNPFAIGQLDAYLTKLAEVRDASAQPIPAPPVEAPKEPFIGPVTVKRPGDKGFIGPIAPPIVEIEGDTTQVDAAIAAVPATAAATPAVVPVTADTEAAAAQVAEVSKPRTTKIKFEAPGLNGILDRLAQIKNKTIKITVNYQATGEIPRWRGGPTKAGGLYRVAERGPEIWEGVGGARILFKDEQQFIPPTAGTVLTAAQTRRTVNNMTSQISTVSHGAPTITVVSPHPLLAGRDVHRTLTGLTRKPKAKR